MENRSTMWMPVELICPALAARRLINHSYGDCEKIKPDLRHVKFSAIPLLVGSLFRDDLIVDDELHREGIPEGSDFLGFEAAGIAKRRSALVYIPNGFQVGEIKNGGFGGAGGSGGPRGFVVTGFHGSNGELAGHGIVNGISAGGGMVNGFAGVGGLGGSPGESVGSGGPSIGVGGGGGGTPIGDDGGESPSGGGGPGGPPGEGVDDGGSFEGVRSFVSVDDSEIVSIVKVRGRAKRRTLRTSVKVRPGKIRHTVRFKRTNPPSG